MEALNGIDHLAIPVPRSFGGLDLVAALWCVRFALLEGELSQTGTKPLSAWCLGGAYSRIQVFRNLHLKRHDRWIHAGLQIVRLRWELSAC